MDEFDRFCILCAIGLICAGMLIGKVVFGG